MNLFQHTRNAWNRLTPEAIVCHELKLLYFSIPKVASSSVKYYLRKNGYDSDNATLSDFAIKNIHGYAYPRIGKSMFIKYRNAGYTAFVVTRDPCKRLWSCYVEKILKKREAGHGLFRGFRRYNEISHRKIFDVDMSFESFVESVVMIPDWLSDGHFRSQYCSVILHKKSLMIDHMIDVDRLNEEMIDMTNKLGIPRWDSPNLNPSKSRAIQPQFNEKIIQLVKKRYERDYLLFNYI